MPYRCPDGHLYSRRVDLACALLGRLLSIRPPILSAPKVIRKHWHRSLGAGPICNNRNRYTPIFPEAHERLYDTPALPYGRGPTWGRHPSVEFVQAPRRSGPVLSPVCLFGIPGRNTCFRLKHANQQLSQAEYPAWPPLVNPLHCPTGSGFAGCAPALAGGGDPATVQGATNYP